MSLPLFRLGTGYAPPGDNVNADNVFHPDRAIDQRLTHASQPDYVDRGMPGNLLGTIKIERQKFGTLKEQRLFGLLAVLLKVASAGEVQLELESITSGSTADGYNFAERRPPVPDGRRYDIQVGRAVTRSGIMEALTVSSTFNEVGRQLNPAKVQRQLEVARMAGEENVARYALDKLFRTLYKYNATNYAVDHSDDFFTMADGPWQLPPNPTEFERQLYLLFAQMGRVRRVGDLAHLVTVHRENNKAIMGVDDPRFTSTPTLVLPSGTTAALLREAHMDAALGVIRTAGTSYDAFQAQAAYVAAQMTGQDGLCVETNGSWDPTQRGGPRAGDPLRALVSLASVVVASVAEEPSTTYEQPFDARELDVRVPRARTPDTKDKFEFMDLLVHSGAFDHGTLQTLRDVLRGAYDPGAVVANAFAADLLALGNRPTPNGGAAASAVTRTYTNGGVLGRLPIGLAVSNKGRIIESQCLGQCGFSVGVWYQQLTHMLAYGQRQTDAADAMLAGHQHAKRSWVSVARALREISGVAQLFPVALGASDVTDAVDAGASPAFNLDRTHFELNHLHTVLDTAAQDTGDGRAGVLPHQSFHWVLSQAIDGYMGVVGIQPRDANNLFSRRLHGGTTEANAALFLSQHVGAMLDILWEAMFVLFSQEAIQAVQLARGSLAAPTWAEEPEWAWAMLYMYSSFVTFTMDRANGNVDVATVSYDSMLSQFSRIVRYGISVGAPPPVACMLYLTNQYSTGTPIITRGNHSMLVTMLEEPAVLEINPQTLANPTKTHGWVFLVGVDPLIRNGTTAFPHAVVYAATKPAPPRVTDHPFAAYDVAETGIAAVGFGGQANPLALSFVEHIEDALDIASNARLVAPLGLVGGVHSLGTREAEAVDANERFDRPTALYYAARYTRLTVANYVQTLAAIQTTTVRSRDDMVKGRIVSDLATPAMAERWTPVGQQRVGRRGLCFSATEMVRVA